MSRLREENCHRLAARVNRVKSRTPATLPGRHNGGQIRQVGPNHEFAVVVMDGHDAADRCCALAHPGNAKTR